MERFPGIRRVFRLGVAKRELDEELEFHFERTVEELVRGGVPEEEARAEAKRRFGSELHYRREIERLDRQAEVLRRWAARGSDLASGLRLAARRMRRSPGFAVGVILTFALGIGANATMFGIVDRLLLSPPAHVEDADAVRRLMVDRHFTHRGVRETGDVIAYPDFLDFTHAESFASVAGYARRDLMLGRGKEARPVEAVLTTASLFPLLGTRPAMGRFFGPEEDRAGAAGVVVISHGFWREHFGGDREVLGRSLDFGFGPYTVVGVAPQGFTGVDLNRVDLWLPLHTAGSQIISIPWAETRGFHWMRAVARLAPGVAPEAAEQEATALHRQGRREQIERERYGAEARVIAAPLIAARGPLASKESVVARWLAGISMIVLLIACANVANLLLARSTRQRREIGIRLALGSSRGRLLGQVLTESLLLAFGGGIAALLLTRWGGTLLRSFLLPEVVWDESLGGVRVAGFVLLLTLLAGAVAGMIPALQAARPDLTESLKSGARGASTPHSRTRSALTVLQASLSVVLLVGAGLFVRSLERVRSQDLGIEPAGVLYVEPVFDREMAREERNRFMLAAAERLDALGGVERAAAATGMPFFSSWGVHIQVPGLDSVPRLPGGGPYINAVDPDYLTAFRLGVLRGRGFNPGDAKGAPPVAVVNETMARTLWPGEEALGRCLIIGGDEDPSGAPPCTEVVGVVKDSRRLNLVDEQPAMQYYIPLEQLTLDERVEALVVRVRDGAEPAALIPAIQQELLGLDPRLRFADVRRFQELIDPQHRSWRLGATMFTAFGILALLVAAIGLYSVLAFGVAQRTQEIGVRSALGASRERLMGLVMGEGLRLVVLGVLIGVGIALLGASRIEPLLFEVSPRDPFVFAGVSLVLLLVAALASGAPAWRATRVDPSVALRAD